MEACCLSSVWLFELDVFDASSVAVKGKKKTCGVRVQNSVIKACGFPWSNVEQRGGPSRLTHADKTTRGSGLRELWNYGKVSYLQGKRDGKSKDIQ